MENSQEQSALELANKQTYTNYREELYKSILSNSENLDRTIITLSTASLGLSLTLIDKLIPMQEAFFKSLLMASWICFVLSIILVIISYLVGQKAVKVQLAYAEEFYIKKNNEFFNKKNHFYCFCEYASFAAAALFAIGITLMTIFASKNLMLEKKMTREKLIQESAPILSMPFASYSDNTRVAPILPMATAIASSGPSIQAPATAPAVAIPPVSLPNGKD